MAQGYRPYEVGLAGGISVGTQSVGSSLTNEPISKEFPVSAGGARMLAVAITTGANTGTVTAKLQTAFYGQEWEDSKTVTLTAGAGDVFYITLLDTKAADQAFLPLYDKCRVVVTTAAASSAIISSVQELQER